MYEYKNHRQFTFTEEGQTMFLSIRDKTNELLHYAGAARMDKMMSGQNGCTWDMMACVDRLVELGEIIEITNNVPGQDRVFVNAK